MKELLKTSLAAVTLTTGAAFGMKAMDNPIVDAVDLVSQPTANYLSLTQGEINHIKTEDETREDIAATFMVSSAVLGVLLFGYRMSDGARSKAEKYGWMIGVPTSFTVGSGMLLALMWQDKVF